MNTTHYIIIFLSGIVWYIPAIYIDIKDRKKRTPYVIMFLLGTLSMVVPVWVAKTLGY